METRKLQIRLRALPCSIQVATGASPRERPMRLGRGAIGGPCRAGASPRSLEGSAMPRRGACTVTYHSGTQCAICRQFASAVAAPSLRARPLSPRGHSAAEAGGGGGREQKGSRPLTRPERDHRLGPQRRLGAGLRCPPPPTTGGCRGPVPGPEQSTKMRGLERLIKNACNCLLSVFTSFGTGNSRFK